MKPVNRKLDCLPLTCLNKPNLLKRRTFRQLMDKSTKDQHKSKEIEWHFVSAMRWDGPDGDQRETLNHFTCRQPVEIKHFILSSLQQYANVQWMRWFPSKKNIFWEIIVPGTQQKRCILGRWKWNSNYFTFLLRLGTFNPEFSLRPPC